MIDDVEVWFVGTFANDMLIARMGKFSDLQALGVDCPLVRAQS